MKSEYDYDNIYSTHNNRHPAVGALQAVRVPQPRRISRQHPQRDGHPQPRLRVQHATGDGKVRDRTPHRDLGLPQLRVQQSRGRRGLLAAHRGQGCRHQARQPRRLPAPGQRPETPPPGRPAPHRPRMATRQLAAPGTTQAHGQAELLPMKVLFIIVSIAFYPGQARCEASLTFFEIRVTNWQRFLRPFSSKNSRLRATACFKSRSRGRFF